VCTAEFPFVKKMQAAYQRKGFRIINVMNDNEEAVRKLSAESPSMILLADPDRRIRNRFGVSRVPSSFLIDRDGDVASIIVQFSSDSLNQMSAQVATLVKLPAQTIADQRIAPRAG
jgi:alkyl hydroperoxide reductase subunit AhpC